MISGDDGLPTISSRHQQETELSVASTMAMVLQAEGNEELDVENGSLLLRNQVANMTTLELRRSNHVKYLLDGLERLSAGFACLDASRPWLCYWILHSLAILDALPDAQTLSRAARFLGKCQHPDGGFAGGPGQQPHLAPTYAAVNALATIGTEEAYNIIDRKGLLRFVTKMKTSSGGFTMHEGGEVDVRGTYCGLNAAYIAGVLTDELAAGAAEFVIRCQTYEGGLGGEPDNEAHGGYGFCGYAALVLLGKQHAINKRKLLRWAVGRQMQLEGGFQGRANKLVDGCYSFWQGGLIPLLSAQLPSTTVVPVDLGDSRDHFQEGTLADSRALQSYILGACQEHSGGLRDKPVRRRDFYHTCYCLSGLSVAQHSKGPGEADVVGHPSNEVKAVDSVINVVREKAKKAVDYFKTKPPVTLQ